jgi:hypothetical protein
MSNDGRSVEGGVEIPSLDVAEGVAVNDIGVYVSGHTDGAIDAQTSQGNTDAFVRAFGVTGTDLWNRTFGTPKGTDASDVVDGSDSLCVTGGTEGALQGQTAAGKEDAYVRAFGFDGAAAGIDQFGTPAWDEGGGVAVDASGMLEVAGGTLGIFPGERRQGGEMVAFLARLSPP